MIPWSDAILLSLLVALIGLDHSAVAQVMVSQPLVGGTLLGAALGRPLEGMAAGAFFQVLCLAELPVGASIPPDGSLAGLVGTALYLTAERPPLWDDSAMLGAAALLFFPLSWLGRQAEILVRRKNRFWTGVAERYIHKKRYGAAQFAALGGGLLFFAKAFIVCLVFLRIGAHWGPLLSPLDPYGRPLSFFARAIPFLTLGIIAARFGRRRTSVLVAAGFVIGFLISRGGA